MIKLVLSGSTPDDHVVLLGLGHPNVQALTNGHPILINLDELNIGATGRLVICYSHDQATLLKEWRDAGIPVPDMPDPAPGEQIHIRP